MQMEEIFPFLFPIFFIGMWIVVSFLLSVIGGWSPLAEYYRSQDEFTGKKWYFQTGHLGLVNYNRCLIVGSNYEGLFLAVFPLFRMGHPPLLIPWGDITTAEQKWWFFTYLDFTFAKAPSIKFRVSRRVGDMIISMRTDSFYGN